MGLPNETHGLTHLKHKQNKHTGQTKQTEQKKQRESSSSSSKETGEEPTLSAEHQSAAAAALPDGWGKTFQKLKQNFPTITVKVFFRLVQKVKAAGFADDEFAAGIEEHGRHTLSQNPEVNPITFGLKVIDAIAASARAQSLYDDSTTSAKTQAEPPPHEPRIELSIIGLCPEHKHEVVWTPAPGKQVCVDCTEPPGALAAEAKERVKRWFEAEKEIGLGSGPGSGPKQLAERLARL